MCLNQDTDTIWKCQFSFGDTLQGSYIRCHHDVSKFTATVLLSKRKEFHGGEFYLYPSKTEYSVTSSETRPIVDTQQGDLLGWKGTLISGDAQYHGIQKVTSGKRYVIGFWFQ